MDINVDRCYYSPMTKYECNITWDVDDAEELEGLPTVEVVKLETLAQYLERGETLDGALVEYLSDLHNFCIDQLSYKSI